MPTKSQTFRGKRWKILRSAMKAEDGICSAPDVKSRFIVVDSRLTGKRELEVMIHEAMHACHWDIDEQAIEETAADIAAWLWREGYRRDNVTKS